ncbi:MAG: protein kinase [Planctomycetia bacterium]|nr:protein kinase [Planctomycetia bacterium]
MMNENTSQRGRARPASWRSPSKLVSAILRHAPQDQPLDAHSILAAHPELHEAPSALVDLAYEEYCQRIEAGGPVDRVEFAGRFPECRTSLLRLLDLHEFLGQNPEMLHGPAGWPAVGQVFLGYELLEELGQGAFSRVFLAREKALGDRRVVVKITRHGGAEAQALGMMTHDHIVPIYSVKEDAASGLSAICMPYLGRLTCHDLLDRAFAGGKPPQTGKTIVEVLSDTAAAGTPNGDQGDPQDGAESGPQTGPQNRPEGRAIAAELLALRRMPYVDAVLHLGWQLADALRCAHERGVFHCDIKPSNVLLTRRDGAMLLDFNLALVPEHTREMGGTLPYMAPEQLRGVVARQSRYAVDGKTDVFSLGVMLYEMLGGALPWGRPPTDQSRQRVAEELLARQRKGPRPLRRLNRVVDGRVSRLLASCLALEPAGRPAAQELAESLKRELTRGRRALRALVGRRHSLLATGCAVALGGFLGGWAQHSWDRWLDRQLGLARQAVVRGQFDVALDHVGVVLDYRADDPNALFLRARCRFRLRQFEQALPDLDKLEKEFPGNSSIAALRGCCLAGDPNARESDIREALRLLHLADNDDDLPPNSAVYNNIGCCLRRSPDRIRAEESLRKAIALDRGSFAAHFNLGLTILERSRYSDVRLLREARDEFERAASANAGVKGVHVHLAEINVALWQSEELDEKERGAAKNETLKHVRRALALGCARAELRRVCTDCPDKQTQSELEHLLQFAPTKVSPVALDLILDPFESWPAPSF